jgi:hypothetical protein
MITESYLKRRDIAQTIRIDELIRDNTGLIIKLHDSETEIGHLKLAIEQLKDGSLVLTLKLEEANTEIGRLNIKLKRRADDLTFIKRSDHKKI